MNKFIQKSPIKYRLVDRKFVCYFYYVRWSCLSLGFHIDAYSPNIEIHLPFGFIRIGWEGKYDTIS